MYPSFADISIEKKTTATNQPTNTPPTSPTNPPLDRATFCSLPSPSPLFLFFFPCLRVCSFPVGDPGCVLFSLPKWLQKMTGELQMCTFGSRTMKNTNISSKRSTANFGPLTFRPAPFWRCYFFSVIQMFFFLTMFKGTWCFFHKKHFSGYLCFRDTVFFEIQTIVWEYRFSRYIKGLVRDASGWEGNGG